MTPTGPTTGTVERVLADVRARVLLRAALRSAAWWITIGSVVFVAGVWLDVAVGLPAPVRRVAPLLGLMVVLGTLVSVFVSHRTATPAYVTRLVDERAGLGNLMSTVQTPNAEGPVADLFRARTERALRTVAPARIVGLDAGPLWGWATAAVLAAVLSLVGTERMDRGGEVAGPSAPDLGVAVESRTSDRPLPSLGPITVTVVPPSYTGLPTEYVTETTLTALPGSLVRVTGSGTARGSELRARRAGGPLLAPSSGPDGWWVEWEVSPDDRGLSIEVVHDDDVIEQRVYPLRLLRDRAPRVEFVDPDEDLVLGSPSGSIPVRAQALDDFGVDEITLHWVHSRGSGESFDFSEGAWEWSAVREIDGGVEATYQIPLGGLDLEPGDVIHIRATATDENDVTGPGIGVSATRQIRISREDDLSDVTTLIGFPIERDREPLLSQRMIILLTEELRDTAQTLDSEGLLDEAASIADEQARLRARIGEQIFSRATGAFQDPEAHLDFEISHGEDGEDDHGEAGHVHVLRSFLDDLQFVVQQGPVIDPETGIATIADVDIPAHNHDSDPIIAINRSLLTIYNHMWDAERALRSAALDPSLVPQYLALDMLQELRDAERIFPRGRVSVRPIDVPGARGTGELDDAAPSPRSTGAAPPPASQRVIQVLDDLLSAERLATGRAASVMISGLALDLLDDLDDPAASESLVRAAAAADIADEPTLRSSLRDALTRLRGSMTRTSTSGLSAPGSFAAARYAADRVATGDRAEDAPSGSPPFVFATVRYASGDWDSAPLVPTNLIHSLAQYTDLPVHPEGVIVDLSSEEVFDYPFLFLTGHLPVFFDEAESRNLLAFVERGGFVFIDDHNHDIDGAFHRSVTSEIARLFGQNRLTAIPNDHELYRAFFTFEDGPPITGHELSGWGDGLIHRELFQVEVDGRIGVLYSNKDYSSEWSYHAENKRFLAVDNTRFGVNVLVYALTR